MADAATPDLLDARDGTSASKLPIAVDLSDRLSKEIVVALVGPIASGVSTAASFIRDALQNKYKYDVPEIIKISDFIRNEAYRVDVSIPDKVPLDGYVKAMQNAGNLLRETFGANYLAAKVIERISTIRHNNKGYTEINSRRIMIPARRAYIIDSLKNLDEYKKLRELYGDTLVVFGVFAPDRLRQERLTNNGAEQSTVKAITDRDQGDVPTFGQMTRKTFIESDFFICNDTKPDELRRRIERYLEIVFDVQVHTPTRAEAAMYKAEAAAANSACMSRQVGAAILSVKGELIAVGWNDVPKFGGGLYSEDDQVIADKEKRSFVDNDKRCFKYKKNICHNESRRKTITSKICDRICSSNILKKGVKHNAVMDVIGIAEIDALTEYSRSIHAEMEAILSVAREGKHSITNSTLYTTTYPCHNCARHIVAAGIKEVVYIHPYLKSLAIDLHGDAISETSDVAERVVFRQYDGVAPRNFLKLFKPLAERKKDGKLDRTHPSKALPVFRVTLDAFLDYEDKVIADLSVKEQAAT
ncbi:MAG: hypothetical protein HQL40_01505 [Alphaproteobacteria bacterium]|nr:hypothetical protein [Alphaproteobacteria bacterium]